MPRTWERHHNYKYASNDDAAPTLKSHDGKPDYGLVHPLHFYLNKNSEGYLHEDDSSSALRAHQYSDRGILEPNIFTTDFSDTARVADGDSAPTLESANEQKGRRYGIIEPQAFKESFDGKILEGDTAPTLSTTRPGHTRAGVREGLSLRRFTPVEYERFQGFPDDWTDVPWRNKKHSPIGRRYAAAGNAMPVNVMRWIFHRIDVVDKIPAEDAA